MITKLAAATALVLSAQMLLAGQGVASQTSPAAAPASVVKMSVTPSANGTIGLSGATFPVSQSSGSVIVTAVRTGATLGAMSVTYTTTNGNAIAGTNYTAETGTLTWASGDGSAKTFTIPVNSSNVFTGTKYFVVKLAAGANTILGSHTNATVTITGGTVASTPPTTPPKVVKSIKQWVTCSETIDESNQLAAAIEAAGNNAFELLVDCPVRFHTGTANASSITVPDGVTIQFTGAGEFLTVGGGPPALAIAHPQKVTFIDYNQTYL